MKEMKKVLLPTDFSENANNAFDYALEIANKSDAVLSIVHGTYQPYIYGADTLLRELADRNNYRNVRVETELIVGNILPAIFELSADLIVMGTKGRSNFGNILFGSISATVMLESATPVIVVPYGKKYTGFKHLLFTTDLHDGDVKALKQLAGFGRLFDAKITVFHVDNSDKSNEDTGYEEFSEKARKKVEYSQIDFELQKNKDLHNAISDYVVKNNIDLVVFNRYKKTFFRSIFEKNKIKKAAYGNIPLMVIPCEEY